MENRVPVELRQRLEDLVALEAGHSPLHMRDEGRGGGLADGEACVELGGRELAELLLVSHGADVEDLMVRAGRAHVEVRAALPDLNDAPVASLVPGLQSQYQRWPATQAASGWSWCHALLGIILMHLSAVKLPGPQNVPPRHTKKYRKCPPS